MMMCNHSTPVLWWAKLGDRVRVTAKFLTKKLTHRRIIQNTRYKERSIKLNFAEHFILM